VWRKKSSAGGARLKTVLIIVSGRPCHPSARIRSASRCRRRERRWLFRPRGHFRKLSEKSARRLPRLRSGRRFLHHLRRKFDLRHRLSAPDEASKRSPTAEAEVRDAVGAVETPIDKKRITLTDGTSEHRMK
jgi:transposase